MSWRGLCGHMEGWRLTGLEGVFLEGTSFPAGSPLAGGTVSDWGKSGGRT